MGGGLTTFKSYSKDTIQTFLWNHECDPHGIYLKYIFMMENTPMAHLWGVTLSIPWSNKEHLLMSDSYMLGIPFIEGFVLNDGIWK